MGKENEMTTPDSVTAVAAASSANESSSGHPSRPTLALWRGFLGRCPNCGKGAMLPEPTSGSRRDARLP